jgi:hypothetical protein
MAFFKSFKLVGSQFSPVQITKRSAVQLMVLLHGSGALEWGGREVESNRQQCFSLLLSV